MSTASVAVAIACAAAREIAESPVHCGAAGRSIFAVASRAAWSSPCRPRVARHGRPIVMIRSISTSSRAATVGLAGLRGPSKRPAARICGGRGTRAPPDGAASAARGAAAITARHAVRQRQPAVQQCLFQDRIVALQPLQLLVEGGTFLGCRNASPSRPPAGCRLRPHRCGDRGARTHRRSGRAQTVHRGIAAAWPAPRMCFAGKSGAGAASWPPAAAWLRMPDPAMRGKLPDGLRPRRPATPPTAWLPPDRRLRSPEWSV